MHRADFSTTPLPHTTCISHERGRCCGDVQAQSYGVEAAVGSIHCGILQGYVLRLSFDFLGNVSQQAITSTTKARLATRTVRCTSYLLSLRGEPIWFGAACRARRLL